MAVRITRCAAAVPIAALVLAATAPSALATPTSAGAVAHIVAAYDPPRISVDGAHITWDWTLTNTGTGPAGAVTFVSKLVPSVPGVHAGAPCAVAGGQVRCLYPRMSPGARQSGAITVDLPDGFSGTLHIQGTVTWRDQGAARTLGLR